MQAAWLRLRRAIKIAAPEGGYIMSSSHTILSNTPIANLTTYVKAAVLRDWFLVGSLLG